MLRISDKLYTAAQLRQLDSAAIEVHGIAAYELMTRAGNAVVTAALSAYSGSRRWLVLCGGGNNGGDGYVAARLAAEAGVAVRCCALKPVSGLKDAAATAAQNWLDSGGEIHTWAPGEELDCDLVVDALLGTGLDREVSGAYFKAISMINDLACATVAIDIPSGLNADTGCVMGVAVQADLTVSFIGQKRGLFTADGPDYCGTLEFDTLQTPAEIHKTAGESGTLVHEQILADWLPRRKRNSHKGKYGHVLVVGGVAGMGGAALLAGESALRSGAGLVTVGTHPAHAHWLNLARPELMIATVAEPTDLAAAIKRASVLAVGPGLGKGDWARKLLAVCLDTGLPLVVDADALNLLAESPLRRGDWILTPHPAEAARLLGVGTADIQSDRVGAAQQLASRYDAVVILKGCGSVIASPGGDYAICLLGNPGMSTAGSGDVLTGVVAGMLAQGFTPWLAAQLATVAHGAAGDRAAAPGQRGLLASDISARLPAVLNP